ncbi:FAD-binding oxidoreductase [Romeria aff. gracilis LEGE 07310]|uniref:FAD-binding oxidoreductase n=1 Tax=Vasconcelosia minhoensis LEGE 07310 TaxID=915328 RepID=A0A8J7A9S6_9CYAN|nr:FAD-binding oxidoreductase [Romeria gracilis]MBE9078850.1 FAD-binding oxidoreductase [Romeria aff. gracilis LEGE 07310]
MQTYDWIVVGNGLAGAALSYELAKVGQRVLLLDDANPDSGTRYSYGGIPDWAGTDALTRSLYRAGMERQRNLSSELGAETQFRELDLLLTILPDQDPQALAAQYAHCDRPPQLISPQEAQALEPQLDPGAIAAALTVRQGHVHPTATVAAYNQAFRRLGGQHFIIPVTGLVRLGAKVTGVTTSSQAYPAGNVVLAAGAYTRKLLQAVKLPLPLCFTHAEIIETPPLELSLRTLIMPAYSARAELEEKARQPQQADLWSEPGRAIAPPILDTGVIQFLDRSIRIGQISRLHTSLEPIADAATSEALLREAISAQMPTIKDVPGTWRHCLVSFTSDSLPLVGPVADVDGLHVFTGFTSPFAMLPPIAEQFARWTEGTDWPLLANLSPQRPLV